MKRRKLLNYLISNGCVVLREGARHTVICNPSAKRTSTVPRHTEINDFLARKICRDVVAYGSLLKKQFENDVSAKKGFAEWHSD